MFSEKYNSRMSRDRCHGIRCADWLLGGRKCHLFLGVRIKSSYFPACREYRVQLLPTRHMPHDYALAVYASAYENMVPDPCTRVGTCAYMYLFLHCWSLRTGCLSVHLFLSTGFAALAVFLYVQVICWKCSWMRHSSCGSFSTCAWPPRTVSLQFNFLPWYDNSISSHFFFTSAEQISFMVDDRGSRPITLGL